MRCSGIAVTQLTPKAGSVQETQQEKPRKETLGETQKRAASGSEKSISGVQAVRNQSVGREGSGSRDSRD